MISYRKHRQNIGKTSVVNHESEVLENLNLNSTQRRIVELLLKDPQMTGAVLSERTNIAKRNVEVHIKKLKEMGILIRHGSSRNGFW
ncbi:MAG: winged helix-turn-helix domain-containing protein, partial [Eubacterium sp.]|nr:winged helix-turn-helix domain-containing protein [Eubacterium sp.]